MLQYKESTIFALGVIMERDYYMYLGIGEKQYFSLPAAWELLHCVEDEEGTPTASIQQMTLEALMQPRGTLPFRDLLSGVKSVAVIVDDGTRPTPVAAVLEVLLSRLADKGFSRENIIIVVALGTHAAMERDALEARLGSEVLSHYKVVQHNAWQSDLVPITVPGEQKVVKINPEVAQADLRLGISSILPHPMAGYGGGPKILMPGVSDFEYVRDHHVKYVIHPRSVAGATKGNPFHEGCMRAARAIGLDFSINCVYNQQGQIIRIIGGSLEMAFGEAVKVCYERLGHRFEEKVDVTITSSYPHTHGHQFFKGLSAPDSVTKETGAILIVAPVDAPLSAEFLNSFREVEKKSHNNSAAYVRDTLSKGMAFLPDKPIDFNMAMSTVFLRPQIRTILVSPSIPKEEVRIMGLEYAPSIEEGLRLLEKAYPEATVAIFPSGGLIVPIVDWER
jgi:nickel-dependent lactate racemase